MSRNELQVDRWEERIVEALETAPRVNVPQGFAARVMASLPEQSMLAHVRHTHYGRNAAFGSALLLCALLLAFLGSAQHGSLAGAMVAWIAFVQLAGIALWLIRGPLHLIPR